MTKRRLWVPLLAAGVVTMLVVGATGSFGVDAEAGDTIGRAFVRRSLTLAPGAFHVTDDDTSYDNAGDELAVKGPSADGTFTAPLFFEDDKVRISSLILYAYDNGADAVCLSMFRTTPANGDLDTEDEVGHVCSTGATTGIRTFSASNWSFRRVGGSQGPYLYLYIPGLYTEGYGFYGAKIVYTYDH